MFAQLKKLKLERQRKAKAKRRAAVQTMVDKAKGLHHVSGWPSCAKLVGFRDKVSHHFVPFSLQMFLNIQH